MFVSLIKKSLWVLSAVLLVQIVMASEVKVVSYNIKHGEGMDGRLDLDRTAAVLRKLNADVIALQEVDKNCVRSGGVDQAAVLAEKLGMHYFFGKAIDLGNGEYGNAVLSKYPLVKTAVHRLPGSGEKRVAVEMQMKIGGELVSVLSVHLDHQGEQLRLMQLEAIDKAMSGSQHPVILAGDLNAEPDSQVLQKLKETWTLAAKNGEGGTYPSPEPKSELDYCAVRNLKLKSIGCDVVNELMASDHRPIISVLKW